MKKMPSAIVFTVCLTAIVHQQTHNLYTSGWLIFATVIAFLCACD